MRSKKGFICVLVLVLAVAFSMGACKKPDNDGMADEWEKLHGLNPKDPADAAMDADSDGMTNLDEYNAGTNPHEADSDKDGLKDGDEVQAGASPVNPDTDADGDSDGTDCNPVDANINTNAKEGPINTPTCSDTLDNDCDALIDGTDSDCACASDVDCISPVPCQTMTCVNGGCQGTPAPDGTPCDDGNCCTENDLCTANACVPGPQKTCPAGQVCDMAACACAPAPTNP